MPTRNIRLSPEQDSLLESMLRAGEYSDASALVSEALHALHRQRRRNDLRLERLRLAVHEGVAALDRGEFTELEDDELDTFLDELADPSAL